MTDTPLFDAWRRRATKLLLPRGRKAELAAHLASCYVRLGVRRQFLTPCQEIWHSAELSG